MNAAQLKKNLYQRVKIRPIAVRKMESTGEILRQIDDEWMIMPGETGVVTLNSMRTSHTISLPNDSVKGVSGHCTARLTGRGTSAP